MANILAKYHRWQYKNTALLILGLGLLYFLADFHIVQKIISQIGQLSYLGSFLAGIFFVSIFTVAPAIIILYQLADQLNPLVVAILAGAGAVLGDYLIFRFFRDRVFEELKNLFIKFRFSSFIKNLFKTPFFSWLIPVIGAIIIASPFPDEVGLSMMALSKVKGWQFVLVSFLLNAVGILLVIILARSF